jgi:hypothetical protein
MPPRVPFAIAVSLAVLSGATAVPPAAVGDSAARSSLAAPPPLLPDVRALKADELLLSRSSSGHRVLRFESGIANVGEGPLEVRPNSLRQCPPSEQHASQIIFRDGDGNGRYGRRHDTGFSRHATGCMAYHPAHSHWHLQAAARYRLYQLRRHQALLVSGRKMSFCLRDSRRAPARWSAAHYAEFYGECSQSTPQGVSIGWVDVYQNFLPGQSIRVPDSVRDGTYCLRSTVDPLDALRETDDRNNTSVRAMALRGMRVAARPTRRCT